MRRAFCSFLLREVRSGKAGVGVYKPFPHPDPPHSPLRGGGGSKALLLLALLLASPAHAERIKDIARFAGVRANALTGYGVVVGLSGTGDQNLEFTIQSLKSATARLGVLIPPGIAPQLKNAAAVMITAELPPFAKPGQRLDVTVSALGQAKSLRGGTLLLAPMQGADGEVYALAQGNLAVGGFGAEGKDGSKIVVGTPSSGRIPGGASVERQVASPFAGDTALRLDLIEQDFSAAGAVAAAINARMGAGIASTDDAATITIRAPADTAARVALAAAIESLDVRLGAPVARVIVNAAGVWADDVRALDEGTHPDSIRPAKGVHITVPWDKVRNDIAVVIPVPESEPDVDVPEPIEDALEESRNESPPLEEGVEPVLSP